MLSHYGGLDGYDQPTTSILFPIGGGEMAISAVISEWDY
jgi:hypothetical protein